MDSVYFCLLRVCGCTLSQVRLCDPLDCSPPGSSVHGTLQVRVLEWAAVSSSGIFPAQGSNLHLLPLTLAGGFFTTSAACELLWNGCLALLHSHLISTRQVSQELVHVRHADCLQTISLSCLNISAKINPESRKENGSCQFSLKTLKAGLRAQSFPVPHRHLLDGAAKRTPSKPRPRSSCSPDDVETGQGNFHLLSALRSCPTLNHGLSTEASKDTSSQMQIVYSGAPSAPQHRHHFGFYLKKWQLPFWEKTSPPLHSPSGCFCFWRERSLCLLIA